MMTIRLSVSFFLILNKALWKDDGGLKLILINLLENRVIKSVLAIFFIKKKKRYLKLQSTQISGFSKTSYLRFSITRV